MEDLRSILAIIGIGVIVFVYWYTRREQTRSDKETDERVEPQFEAEDRIADWSNATTGAAAESAADNGEAIQSSLVPEPETAPKAPEKIVAIRLVAKGIEAISGEKLIIALRALGLRHGKFGIFHHHEGDDDQVVFSVANLLEPGNFDLTNIREQELPGVSLFMVLPGPLTGPAAFDAMIETARALAKTLDGELLDAAGSSLSIQRERFIREEIIQYEHGLKLG